MKTLDFARQFIRFDKSSPITGPLTHLRIAGVCGIYCFIHRESGMHYVGSSTDIARRLSAHLQSVKKGSMNRFHRALREFGWLSFDLEILEECLPLELLTRERFYIALLNSASLDGLNTESHPHGSRLGSRVSDATKARISASLKGVQLGKKVSDETRKRIGEKSKGRYFSPESRLKMGLKQKAFRSKHPPQPFSKIIQRIRRIRPHRCFRLLNFSIRLKPLPTEEHKRAIAKGGSGRIQSESEKAKRAAWHKGKIRTPEQRERMRLAQHNMSPEKKARIDAARHKKRSPEARARMRAGIAASGRCKNAN